MTQQTETNNNATPVQLTPIAEYSKTAAALADLAARYQRVVFDVTTREGMTTAIKARAELRGYRVALEKTRVELKAPALERARLIDAEAKRITAELVAMESPIDEAIKSEETRRDRERAAREQAERERVAEIQRRIADISAIPAGVVGKSWTEIVTAIENLSDYDVAEWAQEFAVQAAEAKGKALATLEQLRVAAEAQERERAEADARAKAEREELARLRAEQEAREAAENERRKAAEIAEREAAQARALAERETRARIAEEERVAKEARDKADREAQEAREAADAEAAAAREAQAARQAAADAEAKAARDAEQARQDAEAKRIREESDRIEAERREVERLQNELLDGARMLAKFVERFGKRREFAAVVKAIREYEAKHAEPAAQEAK